MSVAEARMSVDDFLERVRSGELSDAELIGGKVFTVNPVAGPAHSRLAVAIVRALMATYGIERVVDDKGIQLRETALAPDITVLTTDYLNIVAEGRHPGCHEVECAIEVAITSRDRDLELKLPSYQAEGVAAAYVLVVDESASAISVHGYGDHHAVLAALRQAAGSLGFVVAPSVVPPAPRSP